MRKAVITGSTKGIGFALARELLSRGHSVVVSGRSRTAVDDAVARLRPQAAAGPPSTGSPWTSPTPRRSSGCGAPRSTRWAASTCGSTTPVSPTPPGRSSTPRRRTSGRWSPRTCSAPCTGRRSPSAACSPAGGGQVFNVLGGGSDGRIRPGMGVYSATKRGLDSFTRALAKEVTGTGVRIGQIPPRHPHHRGVAARGRRRAGAGGAAAQAAQHPLRPRRRRRAVPGRTDAGEHQERRRDRVAHHRPDDPQVSHSRQAGRARPLRALTGAVMHINDSGKDGTG